MEKILATTYQFLISGVFSDNAPMKAYATDEDYPVITMDVIHDYTINLNNKLSNYPVESRSNISDHIFSENIKIQFTASIGHAYPVGTAILANSVIQYNSEDSIRTNKPLQMYNIIKKLRDDKLEFDVLTEQELFTDMVITDLSVAKQSGDDQLNFNITLEKARKVTIGKTVLASVSASSSTAKGKEIKNKTAAKSSEGTKNSGNTTSANNKVQKEVNLHNTKLGEAAGIPKDKIGDVYKDDPRNISTNASQ